MTTNAQTAITVGSDGVPPDGCVACPICYCSLPFSEDAAAKHHDWHISMGQADARGASWA